jgi:hypothetical protein
MKKIAIFAPLFALVLTVSCADDKKKTEPEVKTVDTTEAMAEETAMASDIDFKEDAMGAIFNQYIDLKTALVNTDATTASAAASNLMTAFANVGVDAAPMKAAQNIVESSNIEEQRTAFVAVTTEVEKMLEGALDSGTIYKQYCPMAFDNTGAYWLSESKEIRNPYFGDKMLKCGRIDAKIE